MLFHLITTAALTAVSAAGVVNYTPTTAGPTVKTLNGTYVGYHNELYNQDFFLGMPFAQPPLGDLRFAPPASLNSSWSGVRNASTYGTSCVGYDEEGYTGTGLVEGEDCLNLNVVRPAGQPAEPLPVAVWIYGGGWYYGSSAEREYNTSFLVERSVQMGQPIIAVAMNYRLASWGWLYSDEIVEEGATNVGMRDQRLALHWIQENIAAFGGDPKRVTIFGESAGAGSVGTHVLAYNGRDDGLFSGAIAQSGSPAGLGPWQPDVEKLALVTYNLTETVCPGAPRKLECLRKASFDAINNATRITKPLIRLPYGPVVDGDIIARPAEHQLRDGSFVKVPYLLGTNNDEGRTQTPLGLNTANDVLQQLLSEDYHVDISLAEGLMSRYLHTNDSFSIIKEVSNAQLNSTVGFQLKRFAGIVTDLIFVAPTRFSAHQWQKHNFTNLYVYNANTTVSKGDRSYGAAHGLDLPYMFYNLNGTGWEGDNPPFSGGNPFEGRPQSYIDLAKVMSGMWVSFFNNGVPGYENQPVAEWPPYKGDDPSIMIFDAQPGYLNTRIGKEDRKEETDYISSQLYPERA